jgi:hypothetical protein
VAGGAACPAGRWLAAAKEVDAGVTVNKPHMSSANAIEGHFFMIFARLKRLLKQLRSPGLQGHGQRVPIANVVRQPLWQTFATD